MPRTFADWLLSAFYLCLVAVWCSGMIAVIKYIWGYVL